MKQIYLFLIILFLGACSQSNETAEYLPFESRPDALIEPNSKLISTEEGYFIFNRVEERGCHITM